MNMKKVLIMLSIVISLFFLPNSVFAARKLCTSNTLSKMRAKAYNVNFDYEFIYPEGGDYYFEVSILNLTDELEVEFGGLTYSYDKNNAILKIIPRLDGGKTYEFEIYAAYGQPCVGELLYTKKLSIPKYNIYSEEKECIQYEEFPLCNKWYQGDIKDKAFFYEKLNAYIKSLNVKEEKPVEEEELTLAEKFINFYTEHLILSVSITLIVVGGITFVIAKTVIKRKRRTKIDL